MREETTGLSMQIQGQVSMWAARPPDVGGVSNAPGGGEGAVYNDVEDQKGL